MTTGLHERTILLIMNNNPYSKGSEWKKWDLHLHSLYTNLGNNVLQLRTFERGVEGETAACGTGTIASALVAANRGEVYFPVTVIPKSSIPLVVDIIYSKLMIESIILEGTAEIIGNAKIEIDI